MTVVGRSPRAHRLDRLGPVRAAENDSMKRPIEFTIPVDDFDTARLPEGSREPGSAAFKAAVARFYEDEFAQAEGSVAVRFAEAEIRVKWIPKEGLDQLQYAVRLLSAGD